ncbi:MAG: hypothetical protein WC756_12000 [Taibaiella sp.]|jgi:hypothetical protein
METLSAIQEAMAGVYHTIEHLTAKEAPQDIIDVLNNAFELLVIKKTNAQIQFINQNPNTQS